MAVVLGPLTNATINGDSNYILRPLYGLGSEPSLNIVATPTDSPTPYNIAFDGPQLIKLLSENSLNDTFELIPGTYDVIANDSAPEVYTISVTPEPGSLILLATGATGIVAVLRRNRCL